MKKWHLLSIGMVAVHLGYPLCLLIAKLLDMNFVFYSQLIYEIVVTGLFLAAVIFRLVKKSLATGWDWLLLPAVILSGFYLVDSGGLPSLAFLLVNLICAGIITLRRRGWGRILVILLCIPIVLLSSWIGLIYHFFSGWEIQLSRETSPSGEYAAQVIRVHSFDVETEVRVVKNSGYFALFGEFCHKPKFLQCIPEHEPIRIQWMDENTLVINGKIYTIE